MPITFEYCAQQIERLLSRRGLFYAAAKRVEAGTLSSLELKLTVRAKEVETVVALVKSGKVKTIDIRMVLDSVQAQGFLEELQSSEIRVLDSTG